MTLKLIGAGFGRTGTTSIKLALEQIGFGRCYHMIEVFPDPQAPDHWVRAAEDDVDWDMIFKGYTATVDWPGCTFWRELTETYPTAKVLLTVRDSNKWFDSTQATIFSDAVGERLEDMAKGFAPMFEKIVGATFNGRLHDRAHCIAVYEKHNAEVIRSVPKNRLLVYDVNEGWEPLCRFIGMPVPNTPFPKANTTEDFSHRGPPVTGAAQDMKH